MLERKFASNKGLKRAGGSAQVLAAKPVNTKPIKDRGVKAALE